MSEKVTKFLEFEDRVFRAPYNYLKKIGLIDKVKEIKQRFVEIYSKDEEIFNFYITFIFLRRSLRIAANLRTIRKQ